ncbi:MAG: glycosyltransferase family 4 protein [Spirochaetaceae bacterium]|nr:glycosyltransferase family 4 protein [Myxococcales bacterium]MCB9726640.1 glycosyltransferase family 4 protein [Spirochaetaceae bacterium]HPG26355.1 glycosyltransferase family 4 protein [Myxococcota bacterium]
MKILFLTHYFPPEVNAPANRTHEHCRRWVADGHDVTVITGVPNHPRGRIFPGYTNRWIQEERIDGIRVIRTWMYLTPNSGFLRRVANYLLFALTAVLASPRAGRPDVVVATSPQFFVGVAGAIVAKTKRRPFVLEIRDLWPKSIVELGQLGPGPILSALEALERWLYRSAAGIVVNTRTFVDHIAERGVDRDRIELVYNGIDPERFAPRPRNEALLAEHDLTDRFTVAYVGTLGLAHGLTLLVDVAERMRSQPRLRFVLIGDGADREKLEADIARRGLDNVVMLGLQPRDAMPDWIASIDLLLVMLRDLPVFETVIPSKIFEFLAQERPVVLAAKGEIRRMMVEAGGALVIDPEAEDQLVAAIEEVMAQPDAAAERARAGRRWVETGFIRDDLARRMARFLEQIVASEGRG